MPKRPSSPQRPFKLTNPVWVEVTVRWIGRKEGDDGPKTPEKARQERRRVANIPDTSLGKAVLRELFNCHPTDVVMTDEYETVSLDQIAPPLAEAAEPCTGHARYRRLRVRVSGDPHSVGEIVEVANVPATKEGLTLFRQSVERHSVIKGPDGSPCAGAFYDTVYGTHRLCDAQIESLTELNDFGA